jgi:hypothetical protein
VQIGPTVIFQSFGVKPTCHLPICGSQINPSPSNLWRSSQSVTFQTVGVKSTCHLLTCESQGHPSPSRLWESYMSNLNTSVKGVLQEKIRSVRCEALIKSEIQILFKWKKILNNLLLSMLFFSLYLVTCSCEDDSPESWSS